jgi:2-oxoisovalerate dehydrogenase E2 component (dihydrolipoyl transacylase)
MPPITMPQLGESVTEGTIGRWLKKPGDRVERDEPLVEIITDKVNAEIPAPAAGVLERISVDEGVVVAVGQEIAFLATEGDRAVNRPHAAESAGARGVASPMGDEEATDEQPRTSPLVRRLAKEHGLDLRQIRGTGLGGRVTREDVEAYLRDRAVAPAVPSAQPPPTSSPAPAIPTEGTPSPAPAAPSRPAPTPAASPPEAAAAPAVETTRERVERITPTPMRRTIARRMLQSAREIPSAWLMMEADVSRLVRYRESLKESFRRDEGVDLTFMPFFMKATVDSLRAHPIVNASWRDEEILVEREINLGVAVALESGLIVPVIRDAAHKNVVGLAHALHEVVTRARAGKLTLADVEGGTFTVNNTGAFGSIASQPIINYPQAGILTLEAIVKRPVVVGDAIAIRSIVNLCFSFDHRILDGLTAGRFLQSVKQQLEAWGPGSSL